MMKTVTKAVVILSLLYTHYSLADKATELFGKDGHIEIYYGYRINLRGDGEAVMRFKRLMDIIAQVPFGAQTLWAISQSNHRLLIRHSHYAVVSSGRTSAPMTRNLTNGVGEDVEIKFNAYIPDQGSHRVYGEHRQYVEFTAVQNLFHELAHAKHKMTGQWPYASSEYAAIKDENIFRRELAARQKRPYFKRTNLHGESICPKAGQATDTKWGQDLICKSS